MDFWGFVTPDGVAVNNAAHSAPAATAEDTTISVGDIVALAAKKEGVLGYVHETTSDALRVIPLKQVGDQWLRGGPLRTLKFDQVTKVPPRVDQMKIRL